MRFSVVIPTMRREQILNATLESLRQCDPAPYEVIVIDADPEGSSRPVVTAFDQQVSPAVRYLRTVPSLTRQRNNGIDDASGDVIVFLDDDVTIQPDIFARLAEVYIDASVVGGTGRVIVNRAYLFRKNFPQTVLARLQFILLVLTLIGHRLVNQEWRGARGVVDGAMAVWLKR